MVANRRLIDARGLGEDVARKIDALHEVLDAFMKDALKGLFTERFVHDSLRDVEFKLQELWEFPQDENYHSYYKQYKFKKGWAGRTFRCTETGETFTIPYEVSKRDFFPVGKGFIDVGDGYYSRMGGNLVEIGEKNGN